jgi:hypothetical protein
MASERQIKANRKNAKRSTGPKTEAGKAKSARNAFRHGLSRPLPGYDSATARSATLINGANPSSAGPKQDARPDELALIVQAGLELGRIRAVRHELLTALLISPDPKLARRLRNIERYERAAYAKAKGTKRRRKSSQE